MRAPRQPRKPRPIVTAQDRYSGGEIPATPDTHHEDFVPTAPAPPVADWDEFLAQDSQYLGYDTDKKNPADNDTDNSETEDIRDVTAAKVPVSPTRAFSRWGEKARS